MPEARWMRAAAGPALAALAFSACLAACSDGPPDRPSLPPVEGDQGYVPRGQQIFISPMGEPFRAGPDQPYPVAAWFAGADADHDGRLTRAEFLADADRFFRRLDQDGDGVIDGVEIQRYEREIAPEILPQVGRLREGEGQDEELGRRGGGGRRRVDSRSDRPRRVEAGDRAVQGAGLYSFIPDLEPVSSADASFDGRVTLAEWRAKAARDFTRLDPSGSGAVTLSGLPKTPQQTAFERRRTTPGRRRAP